MKKSLRLMSLLLVLALLVLTGCKTSDGAKYKIIVPNGTPLLGMSSFLSETDKFEYEIVGGSDPLVAAFTKGEHDVIVAPVNLGAKMYNQKDNYVLYKTFVWGNFYLASTSEIGEFSSLDGQKVVAFGRNSSPDVMLKVIMQHYGISLDITYVDDVATANSYLMSGQANLIVSAEPSLTVLKGKKTIYTLNLQEEWNKATNGNYFPQAAIFVKKELVNKNSFVHTFPIQSYLEDLTNEEKYATIAATAVELHTSFKTMGQETLIKSMPYCNYKLLTAEVEKAAVENYFEILISLSLSAQVGGKLPGSEFYQIK